MPSYFADTAVEVHVTSYFADTAERVHGDRLPCRFSERVYGARLLRSYGRGSTWNLLTLQIRQAYTVPAYFAEWLSYYIVPAFFADKVERVHGARLLCS